ncbi:MAG: nuclear transport factor 2 family protein [Proteobacteria bacterium]|nr:nuclear transport factor 2 family protein [Pseudomonadota bacterium]
MNEFSAITKTVEAYVVGMARGDAKLLAEAFHPQASSIGHYDGALEWMAIVDFAAACLDAAVPEGDPVPPWEIESIAVAGDTAVVRVVNHWAGEEFRDTLTLLQHEGRWRIVAKVFLHLTA